MPKVWLCLVCGSQKRLKVLNFCMLPFPEAAENAPNPVFALALRLHQYFLWRLIKFVLLIPHSCVIALTNIANAGGKWFVSSSLVFPPQTKLPKFKRWSPFVTAVGAHLSGFWCIIISRLPLPFPLLSPPYPTYVRKRCKSDQILCFPQKVCAGVPEQSTHSGPRS